MDELVLKDKEQFPDEEVIFSHIGKSKKLWREFFDYLRKEHADLAEEWRYYNDGKSWLMKVTRKTKTMFWLSVMKGTFRTTFYFTDKAEEAIHGSPISEKIREQFRNGKKYGKIRGLTVTFQNRDDIADAKALLAVKLAVK